MGVMRFGSNGQNSGQIENKMIGMASILYEKVPWCLDTRFLYL